MFGQLTPRATLLQHTGPVLGDEEAERLHALTIPVVDQPVVEVVTEADHLTGVRLADGSRIDLDALVASPRFVARAEILAPLGIMPTEELLGGHAVGSQVDADPTGATSVPGIWVAGNVADMRAQVVSAAAAGLAAGAAINADLIREDADRAVLTHRHAGIHGEQAWDDRYRSRPQTWSGNPNPALVAEAADLRPGTALDAGAGEGADACWLAARGWRVTGADLSTIALERARAQAERLDLDICWRHLDLSREPAPETYDLVTAHYLHLPAEPRRAVFAHLAAAVAQGGTLLVVGHDLSDVHTTMPRPGLDAMGWSAVEVAAGLGAGWVIEVAEARPRVAEDPDGRTVTVRDAVLRARREP